MTAQKTAVKYPEHKQHVDAKELCPLHLSETPKCAIAKYPKEHALAIDNTSTKADIEANENLMLE